MIKTGLVSPRLAHLYFAGLVALSVALASASLFALVTGRVTGSDGTLFASSSVLIALATACPVKLRPRVNLSLRIAPQLAAAVLLGPALALLATGAGVVVGYLYLLRYRRANRTDVVFNSAQSVLATAIASLVYQRVVSSGLGPVGDPLGLLLAAVGMYLLNTLLVALAMMVLAPGTKFGTTVWQVISSHPLGYAALLATGLLGALLARQALWAVPLLIVPLLAAHAEVVLQRGQAEENARLYHEAQDALQLRDEFMRRAAHELKAPIANLLGHTQLLQHRSMQASPRTEREQQSLLTIAEQGRRLHRLVAMVLDLSRIQMDHLLIERQPVELCALIQRLVEESQLTLKPGMVTAECADAPLMIEGDELRLEQVFYNLFQNAIKYSPDGKPIQVCVKRCGEQACLIVQDHGLGIPSAALSHLFERFYQVPRPHIKQSTGFGVGLYIVNEIVTAHGGRVEVSSRDGAGSTFTVYLPCSAARPSWIQGEAPPGSS